MLLDTRATAFTTSDLLKENQQGDKITPPRILVRVKSYNFYQIMYWGPGKHL